MKSLLKRVIPTAVRDTIITRSHRIIDWFGAFKPDGSGPFVDLPPYRDNPHLRIKLRRFVTTSVGLIVRRGGNVLDTQPPAQAS